MWTTPTAVARRDVLSHSICSSMRSRARGDAHEAFDEMLVSDIAAMAVTEWLVILPMLLLFQLLMSFSRKKHQVPKPK
uniref:Uncharacterized protein n=1 Tax=Oryza punctata TaxID=4537 RepID=A0A0E0L8L9_ORYPU